MLHIRGWAARYSTPDTQGDVIQPGAFDDSLRTRVRIPMLGQHDQNLVIGKWTLIEDKESGLWVEGIVRNPDFCDLLQFDAIWGLSIGYGTRSATQHVNDIDPVNDAGIERAADHRRVAARTLHKLDLLEVSVVSLPMHPLSVITHVEECHE